MIKYKISYLFFIILEEGTSELISEFLIFALRLLIDERLLTHAKFNILKEKAENLTYKDAEVIMEVNITNLLSVNNF